LKDNEVKGTFEAAAEEGLEGRFEQYLAEAEVSHRSWARCGQIKTPVKDCFLWVEDPDKKQPGTCHIVKALAALILILECIKRRERSTPGQCGRF